MRLDCKIVEVFAPGDETPQGNEGFMGVLYTQKGSTTNFSITTVGNNS